jgi:hypothetical protein
METADKKPKGKFNAERSTKAMKSLIGEFKRAYTDGRRFLKSLSEIGDRKTQLRSGENYQRLQDRDRQTLSEFDSYFWNEHWNLLSWTHVMDGVRRWSGDPYHEGRHGELSNQEPSLSSHCYAVAIKYDGQEPKLVFVPEGLEERQRDIEMGLLLQADIDAIKDPYRNKARIVHLSKDSGLTPFIHEQLVRFPSSVGDIENQAGFKHYLLDQVRF